MSKVRISSRIVTLVRQLQSGASLEECRRRTNFDFQRHNVARTQFLRAGMVMPWP